MRGVQRYSRAIGKVYERAATELNADDLRAFVLHQSAQLTHVFDEKTGITYLRRSRRLLNGLLRGQFVASYYTVLSADTVAQWAAAHVPYAGAALATALNSLPNVI